MDIGRAAGVLRLGRSAVAPAGVAGKRPPWVAAEVRAWTHSRLSVDSSSPAQAPLALGHQQGSPQTGLRAPSSTPVISRLPVRSGEAEDGGGV